MRKAQLLLNLIDSADGSVDDSEDAMLEELSMAELTGVDISENIKKISSQTTLNSSYVW